MVICAMAYIFFYFRRNVLITITSRSCQGTISQMSNACRYLYRQRFFKRLFSREQNRKILKIQKIKGHKETRIMKDLDHDALRAK